VARYCNGIARSLIESGGADAASSRPVRILEVGGTGGTTGESAACTPADQNLTIRFIDVTDFSGAGAGQVQRLSLCARAFHSI